MSFAAKFSKEADGLSVSERALRDQSYTYGIWGGQAHGKKAYFVIVVPKPKAQAFEKMIEIGGKFNLDEFGTVIYKGWSAPDEVLKQGLRQKYGLYEE